MRRLQKEGDPRRGGRWRAIRRESEEPPLREPRHWGSERRDPGKLHTDLGILGKEKTKK